jgi:hypothetical protein
MLSARKIVEAQAISAAARHFMVVQAAFDKAAQAAGLIEQFYDVGGYSLRLCFAGPALIPSLTPALAHQKTCHSETPDLTVCLWDTASTGIAMPPPAWGGDAYGARGEIIGFNDDRNLTNFHLGPTLRVTAANLMDHLLDTGIYWIPDANEFPYHELSSPLRPILNWWMSRRGRQLVHAGAVGTADGGVLLAGKGGSGKSTAALASLQSELLYASDDYLLINNDPFPFAHSLYSSAKLNGNHLHQLPHLLECVSNKERRAEEKAILFLNDYYPEKLTSGFPLRAILLPRVTDMTRTGIRKASGAAALSALAPSTIFQLPGAGEPALQRLARLVRQLPSYVLELGADIERIPVVISKLLSEIDS